MKKYFTIPLCLALLAACTPKEKIGSGSEPVDSVAIMDEEKASPAEVEPRPDKIPIDTILASYPNGKKLHLLVLEYYDSLPDKPIKDFEVREADTKELLFRSVSARLALGYETDPMKGEFDSLFVVPTYSISTKDPLKVDLDFIVNGGLSFSYLGDITYPFYKESIKLKFLKYSFQNEINWKVKSAFRFTPNRCGANETELVAQFNKIKSEENLPNHIGGEFMKLSFICFMNKSNPHYETIKKVFIEAYGESDFPYDYYVYIIYLDKFIVKLTSQ
jgi:hypothetical protein